MDEELLLNVDPHKADPASAHDGVFEGGNLIDNTYITANLGLGIERRFNSRMSIFVGSTYQHQITKGLGPQSDKINYAFDHDRCTSDFKNQKEKLILRTVSRC